MATMQDFLDRMAAPAAQPSSLRMALNNPNLRSAEDTANVERIARVLDLNYGMADAGGQSAAMEAKAREIEQNPVANAWTAKDETNASFLSEDRQALLDVYDTLVSSGVITEQDISREQITDAPDMRGMRNAWERGRLQNLISGYGLMFQRGEYENLDELRQKIREARAALQALQEDDPLGIYGAIEQLPRMLGWDMPMQAAWAAAGATAGGIAGSFIPGAGTAAGAGAGGVAGGIAGTLYSAWHSEEGAMAADLLLEMDDAGNFLDEQAVRQAATLYGGLSGAVEAGGEALFLKYIGAPVLKSVKGALDKHLVRDAVREAASNKSLGRVFRSFGLGALKSGAIEGGQEAVQEGISAQIEATTKNLLSETGQNYYRSRQDGALSAEGRERMAEAGLEAFKTGVWFYALPGGLKLTLDTRAALRARDFADAHKQIADSVATSKTRELSPARMESYLQTAGLDGDVLIPADAALQLQQQGVDLAGPLGWEMRDLEEAAALGHDIVMPAARVQSLLSPDAMKAVADIMREAPQAMSAVEAAELNDNLPADLDGLIEQAEEDSLERSAIEGELNRLRDEMTRAVKSAPHLMGQMTSSMDPDTSVGQFVDVQLGMIMQRAKALNRMGIPVSDVLSRLTFQGLVQDDKGRLVTPQEAEEAALRQAEEDALAPFWDTVWGRLDADSLLSDFPDARRELAFQHGRGLFAKRGEGVAVDELADELREMGLLEPDADSSTLVERLKELRRPGRSRARARQGMLQNQNGIQIDGSMLGVPEGSDIREYIKAAKKYHDQLKKESENGKPVIQPQLNKPVRFSSKGWRKNQSAGANPDKWKLFPKLREIIENSTLIHTEEVSKSRRDKFIRFHWLECQVNFEGKPRLVGLTLAEDSDGNLFYNLNADVGAWQKNNDSSNLPAQSMAGESESLYQDASASDVSNIRTKPDGVNLHILPQGPHDTALGSTTLTDDGRYVVQLFRGANLSTLTHETAHVFFLEMERLEREGLADERMLADLAALREWTARMDDDAALKEDYDRYQKHSVYGGADFASLSEFQKAAARSRARQEMLARGFEQYLREGKAPSRKLEGVFTRFRKWLMRVYRDALDLHVELTDEVRDVFDRMLAHEEEMDIRAEAAEVKDETARLLDALELKGAKRLEIEGLIHQAKSEAAEKLRHVRDERRKAQRREWAKEAQEQMEREQVYVARKAIRRTPIDLASFTDVNGEELGKALTQKLPGSTRKEGGVEAEVLAAELGYESAADMARDIIDSPTPGQRVKQLIDQRQAEHDALFDADDFLFEQEQLAEQQEKIAAALEEKIRKITAEQRYRREVEGRTVGGEEVTPTMEDYEDFGRASAVRAQRGTDEDSNGLLGTRREEPAVAIRKPSELGNGYRMARWRVQRDQLRAQARAVLDTKPMGEEVLPEQFRRAASHWMQEERRAILKGNFTKALEANYRARINIELARQAAERRDMVRKLSKRAKRFLGMKKADINARFAVFMLSQNLGLFNPTREMLANAGDKGMDTIKAFFSRMREEGFMGAEDAFDEKLFQTGGPWKGMSWDEFRPYAEAMTMIMHMERESRELLTTQGRVDLQERAEEIAASIYENNAHREPGALAKRNKVIELLKEIHVAHLKADTIALLLDGDSMGPSWRAMVKPINDATWARAERLRKERDSLKKLFSVYTRRELVDMKSKRFTVPGIPVAMTKEQALGVLLNSGNAGNLQRLMGGTGYAAEQVRAIIDSLDERDVRFAQSVWDYFETFRKESFDLEESLTGVRPEAVQAQPVQTRFGLLRGGYFPVVYDSENSSRAVDKDLMGTQTGGFMVPSVDHGSMKQRTARGLEAPLRLSLDVIPRHVAQTVHMLTFRRPVREVAKILRRKEVRGAIEQTAGVVTAKALDNWLRFAAGERPGRNGWERAVSWARKNSALYTMGFKLSTMLAQVTGLLATASEIGLKWIVRGVLDSYGRGNVVENYRSVMALSPMMRNRINSIDREIFEISSKIMDTGSSNRALDPFVRMQSWMESHAFVPMGWVQMVFCDLPTWNGAYAKALEENGGNMEEAALYADAVVERTQVGGADKDLAAVQRGRELGKLMTMFYSYFSALYNLSARRVTMRHRRRDAASLYRLATLAALTWVAEPVLMGMLLRKGPDDDDAGLKDWLAWGAKEAFFNPFNMIIGVRDVAGAVDSALSGYGGRFRLSSALDVFDSAMKFGSKVGKALEGKGDAKKVTLAGAKVAGQATGFINAQELLALETFWDWLDGSTPELELGNLLRKKK